KLGNALRQVDRNPGAVGDESGCRCSCQYTRKRLIVEFPQRTLQLPARVGPHVPARVLNTIFDGATITLPGVSPLALGQKLLVRADAHVFRRSIDVKS